MSAPRFGAKNGKIALSEKDVDGKISKFMESRGWRRIRNMTGLRKVGARLFRFGERGMCDLKFVWYFAEPYGAALNLWVETKAPDAGQRCTCTAADKALKIEDRKDPCTICGQIKWRAKERERGAICWVVDNFEAFALLYEEKFMWLTTRGGGQGRLF